MQRTYVHLPDELHTEIEHTAKIQNTSKAAVIRTALTQGLKAMNPQKSSSADALLEMVKNAKKLTGNAPQDLSVNLDHYTWGGPKRDTHTKT